MASVLDAPSADIIHLSYGISKDEGSDLDLLQSISTELVGEQNLVVLYGKIVDAAVSIARSQFRTMQLLCPRDDASGHGGELQLLYSHGLPPDAIEFWRWVNPKAHSSCTMALKFGQRAIIPDFQEWADIAGAEDLNAFRRTGIRSAQTTPLLSRDGALLGMISTHWSEPHRPSARDLRLPDILARLAADLLERTVADAALRARERELDRTCAALRAVMPGESGVDFCQRIRTRWPHITVVLTSGYSNILARDTHHGFHLLQKPYSVEELSRVLRQARRTRS